MVFCEDDGFGFWVSEDYNWLFGSGDFHAINTNRKDKCKTNDDNAINKVI